MDERITHAPTAPRPAFLVVGCRAVLLARCRAAADRVSVELECAELLALANVVATLRPLAILISADLYGFDPEEFDALARAVGAHRVLVEEGEPLDRLEERLREVVNAQREIRVREAPEPAAARRRDLLPSRSGFRLTAVAAATPPTMRRTSCDR
jgi:hypothetical protein